MEFNILTGQWVDRDRELLFGPTSVTTEFIVLESGQSMARLLHRLELFSSIGQAKKAGWDGPVPPGWSEFIIGKLKTRVFILNVVD